MGPGTCTREALVMEERAERVFTPVNTMHRTVLMAIARGTLQELVFDNRAHLSHRQGRPPRRDPEGPAREAGPGRRAAPLPRPGDPQSPRLRRTSGTRGTKGRRRA
jgi:hypothetical protein